jgi:hypothetical protein
VLELFEEALDPVAGSVEDGAVLTVDTCDNFELLGVE